MINELMEMNSSQLKFCVENKSAIELAKNLAFHSPDILTMSLGKVKFSEFRNIIGVVDINNLLQD
ncbi:unnamed protein product [Spirodela intermedia]|uniref:Uncharacterized protein n=1 Tax=Spirodela intermedia TaxID=51605 RepID=A0ABN7E804_SPIIN|nr:unnamed protein product [Spirodela intermedia]